MDATKGANPFLLMGGEEYISSTTSNNSNPFLMDNADFTSDITYSDNPFFSQVTSNPTSATLATNPFAFDQTDFTSAEVLLPEIQSSLPNDIFGQTESNSVQNETTTDFFTVDDPILEVSKVIQKPDALNLKHTHTVTKLEETNSLYSSNEELAKIPPKRPPPPKSVLPPSNETKDLIMSVTGTMDATSSHLLDRIPPTRTPSPVSMRDLHSPSPTPEHAFADFLEVDKNQPLQAETMEDLFDVNDMEQNAKPVPSNDPFISTIANEPVCDINQNHSMRQELPVRPPRPQPPQKPPPPSRPSPPKVIQPVLPEPPKPNDDMFDMLGDTKFPPIEKPIASKADILSLYSAPPIPKQEPILDLLSETTDIISPIIPDSVISPELSQQDAPMDTSDTQSKGSASSVTFNPFVLEETVATVIIDTVSPTKVPVDNFEPQLIENISANDQLNAFFEKSNDDFDNFAAKFESAAKDETKSAFDPFTGNNNTSAWGTIDDNKEFLTGFDGDEPFDAFLSLREPPAVPQGTPMVLSKRESQESDEDKDFSVFIKPKTIDNSSTSDAAMPVLAPPPQKCDMQNAFNDSSPRFNPFDQQSELASSAADQFGALPTDSGHYQRTDSQETPPTPLFDDDVSQPLENFPRTTWAQEGWELQLRQPNKKKITGQRFWKKIFMKLVVQEGCPILQLFNTSVDKDPFQELPLQPCYSVSDIGAQQYDTYGKIFTVKLQYVFYKERPGVRPGQVTKAERITNKLSQFAAYAIQGDYQGVKEFGSDLKKLGLPVEHAPQVSQLLKLGSLNYEDMKQFSVTIEEALFRLSAHRDRALHYKMEEVQITAVDELYVEQNSEGHVDKQIARVRLFFLGFLSGMPDIELGVNDMRRQGKEVVGRHDIIPVITEEWIRLEAVEFHSCVQQDEYQNTHIIKFKPPDACYIELMRFRIRPPKNRELPLQLKPVMCITGNKVEIRADCLVPGFASRKLGQVPCEDVMIRIPIPECWIYLFRVEKHFRYGSVKSAHRRTGKIKGIERFLGTVETLQESLIEVTSGQAKYEHQHRAIVWRIPRLPKEGQGAYTTHNLVCRFALTSYDQIPDQLAEYCFVEFTMPATQASHTTVRSVSLQNSQSDDPPEKYVRYLARHEYRVGIEHTESEEPNPYASATSVTRTPPAPVIEEPAPSADPESSSDSD